MKFFLPILFLCLTSCQPLKGNKAIIKNTSELDTISWLLSKWEMQTPEGIIIEEWTAITDSSWRGVSYMFTPAGDTPFRESIRLINKAGTLYYIPTVSDQNAGQEVIFKQKALSSTEVTFENPNHDFPQTITYTKASDTTVMAQLLGTQNAKTRIETFPYKKVGR
jgi:NADPH:quinone reductase-like Zn-dependent oxidoreductase